ncbi:MAG: hypothetical protein H7288_13105 [Kineosporiaceae bacterium]|nr:hypothetical protein [Aeromicrobium sp.]
MGWISNDNLHEGYLEVVLADGKTSSTSNATGPVIMLTTAQGNYTGKDEQCTHDEVVAWVLRCDCPSSITGNRTAWVGDRWERVATPALEDPENGRIYVAPGDFAVDVMDRPDVEAVARSRWLAEHVSPHEALAVIRTARTEIAAAKRRLDEAVLYARASGETWATVGEAAGTTRQSAQERWGPLTS